jgi:hypothetical protein
MGNIRGGMRHTQIQSILKSLELVKDGKILAHPDFLTTPLDELVKMCNQCGPAGKFGRLVPNTIWGLWIGPNCNVHDHWYAVTASEEDKAQGDREMLTNNLRAIEACSTWIMKPPRRYRAITYYGVVVDCGSKIYWKGKEL